MAERKRIGWIGLGQMGFPMAERLLGSDADLHVHDPSPGPVAALTARGAVAHDSPRGVADHAEIVFACLPSRKISEAVAESVSGGAAVKIHVETSTIGRSGIRAIGERLARSGIITIDAPVSGGPPAAREGRLHIMASGPDAAMDALSPLLLLIGKSVSRLGPEVGQAQTMKVVNNVIMAANMVVAAEGLAIGAKAGLGLTQMIEILSVSTGASRALAEILGPNVVDGAFSFGAHLSIVQKDTALGASEAADLQVPTPALDAVTALWREAAENGFADKDFTRIAQFVAQRGGVALPGAN